MRIEIKNYPFGGTQKLFFFKNGYGASVIKNFGSYGFPKYWELAVIKADPKFPNFDLCYNTPIANDVIGYLTPLQVRWILLKIWFLRREK